MQIRECCEWRIADNRTRNKEDPPPPVCPWGIYKILPALGLLGEKTSHGTTRVYAGHVSSTYRENYCSSTCLSIISFEEYIGGIEERGFKILRAYCSL